MTEAEVVADATRLARQALAEDGARDITSDVTVPPSLAGIGVIEVRTETVMAGRAWADAGRSGKPWKIGGFWYSLADEAEATLRHYAYEYLRIAGHALAQAVADSMTQFTRDRVLETMRAMRETGIDELFMVPGSHAVCEVERLAPLVRQL